MKSKIAFTLALGTAIVLAVSQTALAHVVVTPSEVRTAERVTFSVSVPNEKDVAVTGLRLEIPKGLKSVTPTVKQGWTIEAAKDGDTITRISWQGSEIPAGQRDDFTFRAQAPEQSGELRWNAYQTYADGSIVAWDQASSGDNHNAEKNDSGPFSVTKVSNEITNNEDSRNTDNAGNTLPLVLSLIAVVASAFAILRSRK
jgi:uncharacterized protein YcnI